MAISTTAAVLGGAALAGSVGSAVIQSRSASKAAKAQTQAAQSAEQLQLYMFEQNREDAQRTLEESRQSTERARRDIGAIQVGGLGRSNAVNAATLRGNLRGNDSAYRRAMGEIGAADRQTRADQANVLLAAEGRNREALDGSTDAQEALLDRARLDSNIAYSQARGDQRDAIERIRDTNDNTLSRTLALQEGLYDQARGDLAAYQDAGVQGLDRYASELTGGFRESPGYQFRFDEGMRAMNAARAAAGGRDSGAAMKEAIRYGQGVADQEYDQYLNRLSGLASMGQGAAGQAQQAGQFYGGSAQAALGAANQIDASATSNRANALQQAGAQRAANNISTGGNVAGAIQNALQNYAGMGQQAGQFYGGSLQQATQGRSAAARQAGQFNSNANQLARNAFAGAQQQGQQFYSGGMQNALLGLSGANNQAGQFYNNAINQAGQAYANNAGNALMQGANAQAAGAVAQGNAMSGALNNLSSLAMTAGMGGFGGAGGSNPFGGGGYSGATFGQSYPGVTGL